MTSRTKIVAPFVSVLFFVSLGVATSRAEAACAAYARFHPLMTADEETAAVQALRAEEDAGCMGPAAAADKSPPLDPSMNAGEIEAAIAAHESKQGGARTTAVPRPPAAHPMMTAAEERDFAETLDRYLDERCATIGCPPAPSAHPLMSEAELATAIADDLETTKPDSQPASNPATEVLGRLHPLATPTEQAEVERALRQLEENPQ